MIHILAWLIVLGLATYLFKKASGTLSIFKPNMVNIVFYYSMLVSSFIGPLFIVLEIDDYYMINRMLNDEYRYIGFYLILFVMLFLPLVMFIVTKLSGIQAEAALNQYLKSSITVPKDDRLDFFIIGSLSFISLVAILYTLWKSPYIPILNLLMNNTDLSAGQLRIEASRNFQGNVLIRNIFAIAIPPLLTLITFGYASATKGLKWRLLFVVMFSATVFMNIYDLAKSPIFFFGIMFLLMLLYTGRFKLNVKKVSVLLVMGTGLLVTMYVVIQGVTNINSFLSYNSGPVGRLILAQISPFFLHLDLFGDRVPFLYGQSLPGTLTGLFDQPHVRSARVVMEEIFPERIADGTGGVLNTLYAAEAYANFGYLGVVVSTIYIAALIQCVYLLFLKMKKTPVFMALFVYFSINFPRTVVGGFADFLFNPIWMMIVTISMTIIIISKNSHLLPKLRIKKKFGGTLS
ncbi:O-antigen polymerase [Jeotgalibacillus sp. R-1-5s-1]|uniref:O-antigen polymerase n=1 Tax=Jeotgalibacillus sp. R-1-5s-1 TaxID=2555897 RepID=UPI00106B2C9A|nr:O-antigen polymerase [Jeotgalibacillus sp. R-1-5s-1]TFD95758.1 oligosaccharide repeat unit polymerase [Jeotgalibacillus sp. R-1-5s-1]